MLDAIVEIKNAIHSWRMEKEPDVASSSREKKDPLIPKEVKASTDVSAKALRLFKIFMEHVQVQYSTKTTPGKTVWDKGALTACATNCQGLIELLRRAGLEAAPLRSNRNYFITKQLPSSFIDPTSNGNIRKPGEQPAQTRRFFFTEHHIVEVKGGPYLDATAGVVTDPDGKDVYDDTYKEFKFASAKPITYETNEYRLTLCDEDKTGSIYELTPLGAPKAEAQGRV